MSNANDPQLHDFLAAALVPTNEQRILKAVEETAETVKSIETRLFAYINSLTPKADVPTPKGKPQK